MRIRVLLLAFIVGLLNSVAPLSASATVTAAPAPPEFNQVQLKVLADNDFAVFMGNDQQITRRFYENDVSWPQQIQNIQTLNVFPNAGETFIYIMPMGGNSPFHTQASGNLGGEEDWNGVLNNIPLLDYPGGQVAVGRSVADPKDVFHSGYLVLHKHITNYESSASAIAEGWFTVPEQDAITLSQNLIWSSATRNDHPLIPNPKGSCSVSCSGSSFNPAIPNGAWDIPDATAALFRYPLSRANLPVSPGDRQVTVTWKDPGAGGAVDNYLIEYKETSQPDSAFKVFGTVPGTSRTSTVTGLTNGTPYTLRVTANNAVGSASSYGRSVVPTGTPDRPSNQSYAAGDGSVSINFSPPENDGGAAVTNYAYSVDDGVTWITRSPASTASPITIPNLTNGATVQVKLRAINPFGAGAASLPITVKAGIVQERTLTYDAGTLASVTGLPVGATLNAGDTFTVPAGPTRTNFTFTGWKEGNTPYAPGATYTVGATNPTLTAQWVQNSMLGVTPESRSKVLTWNIVSGESIDVTVAAGTNNSVRIQIPDGALAAGTEVIFWRLTNDQLAKAKISNERDYFVNLAITWSKGDDVNSPKVVADAALPIVVTLMNSTIVAGATAWQIVGDSVREIGKAERAGELVLRFTEDPVITAANVPPMPIFSAPVATADGFEVNITNYDSNFTWEAPSVSAGSVAIVSTVGAIRKLVVTGLTDGQSATITQRTLLSGVYQTGRVTGSAISTTPPQTNNATPVQEVPVTVVTPPNIKKKSAIVTGFAGGSWVLSKTMKKSLDSLLAKAAGANRLTCVGYTMGPTVLKVDRNLAQRRAQETCRYLISKKPSLVASGTKAVTTKLASDKYRRTLITFSD